MEPVFSDYDGKAGTVEWSTPAACAKESPEDPPEPGSDEGSTPSGSGLGWFFFLCVTSRSLFRLILADQCWTLQVLPGSRSLLCDRGVP
jgi:hypothetical protein